MTIRLDPNEQHQGEVEVPGEIELFSDGTFALFKVVDGDRVVGATGELPRGKTLSEDTPIDNLILPFDSGDRAVRVTIVSVEARCGGRSTPETLPTHVRDARRVPSHSLDRSPPALAAGSDGG